ncbi:MAG: type II toxin-antitoxin system VapC family toxin [Actinomycetota bacterium]|nr:type II toxin-antitoxin system VapC family toxin [Actinomycetota bacterium]
MTAAYLDASALVKLMRPEPETEALIEALAHWPVRIASEVVVVELGCTARRLGGEDLLDRAGTIVDGLDLIPFSATIRKRAVATAFDPPLRALAAIHLATALELGDDLDAFVAYDDHLRRAADAERLGVESPRATDWVR